MLREAANGLLVHDGNNLYLKNLRVDAQDLSVHPTVWPYTQFTKQPPWEKDFGESPLVSTGGFLDDTLYDRTSYILDQRHSARKIAFTDDLLVGLRWDEANNRMLLHNHFFQLDQNRYTIFVRNRSAERSQGGQPRGRSAPDLWEQEIDVRVAAMAMTGGAVFVAGVPMPVGEDLSAEFALQSIRARLNLPLEEIITRELLENEAEKLEAVYIFAQEKNLGKQLNKDEITDYILQGLSEELKLLYEYRVIQIVRTKQVCVGIHFPQL